MNEFDQLRFNVEAIFHAVKEDRKVFASIYNFVERLNALVTIQVSNAKREDILFLAEKIEYFFSEYRPSGGEPYMPPHVISRCDKIVRDIYCLSKELAALSDDEFNKQKSLPAEFGEKDKKETKESCVFIGHGRSKLWARLQLFLQNELGVKTIFYESESRVSELIVPILQEMLENASFAVMVLTAEDQTEEGIKRARQNVIHEAGLFQGRLGFDKVVLLIQKGIEGFTNVDGLQCIMFTDDNIEEAFYPLQRDLKKKEIIK